MSDLLSRGQAWLANKLKTKAAIDITYRRGEVVLTLKATVGSTRAEVDAGNSTTVNAQIRDYLIDAADLKDGSFLLTPRDGDVISETVDGQTLVYQVVPIGSEPCWRYSDTTRLKFRIHTAFMSTIPA